MNSGKQAGVSGGHIALTEPPLAVPHAPMRWRCPVAWSGLLRESEEVAFLEEGHIIYTQPTPAGPQRPPQLPPPHWWLVATNGHYNTQLCEVNSQ